ncbi:MAG: thrombospondin type 3 repeat-containing protein, partial [Bacteroidetes bacterium]|nr:thrombospondin type 3 repeat-containing protein [Bacteroidota bacterium]
MKQLIFLVLFLSSISFKAQDFMGLQTSNYAGVLGVYSNPANIADSRFKTDIVLIGVNFVVDNNYVGVKRSALKHTGKYTNPSSLEFHAFDTTRKGSQYYWKNNFVTANNTHSKSIYTAARIVLPSFMISIDRKSSIAFNWSVRNYVNVDGISQDLAKLAYEEFQYPSLWVTKLQNKNLSIQQMTWAEYGLTYARVIKEDGPHFFKVGATVKLLQGLSAAYVHIKNLNYSLDTTNVFNFFSSDVAYGHSSNFDFNDPNNIKYKFQSFPGFGFDIGGVYEWRPDYQKFKYDMDGETGLWRRDQNKYKLKASFAVNDIGGIRYKKGSLSNDFTANINAWNVSKLQINSVSGFDSTMTNVFGSKNSDKTFKMALPTSINAQLDYNIWKPFYINLMANICNLTPNRDAKVHDFTAISLSPRFDHKWFGVTIPVTYSSLTAIRNQPITGGLMLRAGPLVLGSSNFMNYFSNRDIYGANFYFILKVPIPYGRPRDRDKDKVSDKKDVCKDIPGVWEFMGCPDKDGDHIKDADDKCPDVPGTKELQGCPDKDGDGITDAEDKCPDDKGPMEFKGCPDKDGDKIIDKEDECPEEAGIAEFMGCPDKDGDGTPDKYDACPDIFGPKEYKGCPDKDGDGLLDKEDGCPDVAGPKENKGCPWPDTDKDGVLDKDDLCPTVPGVVEHKGCPPPPPVKAAEQKIIERAFKSLEFATAKDIIKPKSYPSLNDLAKLLQTHKGDWKLKLSGHTDN